MSCIFCKIAQNEIPSQKIFENENILAFRDVSPAAPTHILIIPKSHISTGAGDVSAECAQIIAEIFAHIPKIAAELGLNGGFRVVTNCGEDAGQTVPHLHFHLLGGEFLGGMVQL